MTVNLGRLQSLSSSLRVASIRKIGTEGRRRDSARFARTLKCWGRSSSLKSSMRAQT